MLIKKASAYILLTIFMICIFFAGIAVTCSGNDKKGVSDNSETEGSIKRDPPIIIWYWQYYYDKLNSLELVLESGLVNHVAVVTMNQVDFDFALDKKFQQAVSLVKESPAKLIWIRWLWPAYNIEGSNPQDLLDVNYYRRQIRNLREDGEQIGADYIGFDTEAYANSPLKKYLRSEKKLALNQNSRLSAIIEEVIELEGKIDFVLPAGSNSMVTYNYISDIGEYRISETTYYDNTKRINSVKYPYEIFGAYVNTAKKNPNHSALPFFLVNEVFEKSEIWSDRKGLLLYPKERKALEVAEELKAYSEQLKIKKIE